MNSYPARHVLAGVPRVHFYEGGRRCPEDIILPSVMRAVLEFLGDGDYGCKHCLTQNPDCRVLCTYAYLVGVSGAASYLSWKDGWHGDNPALRYMSDDATAPERHVFDAIGYEYEWVVKEQGLDNEALSSAADRAEHSERYAGAGVWRRRPTGAIDRRWL